MCAVSRVNISRSGIVCGNVLILPDKQEARCPIGTGRHVSPGRWVCVCACIMGVWSSRDTCVPAVAVWDG
eukprot:5198175-Prymnesium_polylepis.1